MPEITTKELELFVNDHFKEDLKRLENYVNIYNEEIMEFLQLKNILEIMKEGLNNSFKTQMNIGGNAFIQAEVDCSRTLLIDVGKSHFVEFTLHEAIKFVNLKVSILSKECKVIRDESVKKRSEIKLAMIYIAEKDGLANL